MSRPTADRKRDVAAPAAGRRVVGRLLAGGLVAGLLWAGPAAAGDEDISPNAYQEFDPVTGYMITVDPDAEQQQGHGTDDQAGAGTPEAGSDAASAWIYWVVAGAALAGAAVWLRSRLSAGGPR